MSDDVTKLYVVDLNDKNGLLHAVLKTGDTLTTPTEGQMLININGVSINSKPRSDGRYQGYVTENNGKQYFYGRTREEFEAKIIRYLKEAHAPKKKAHSKKQPTFGEFYEKWLELYKKPNLKPSSITNIVDTMKPALTVFAGVPIDKITTDDVQGLLLSINAPAARTKCKVNVNQVFTKAQRGGLIKINPCDNLEIKKPKEKHIEGLTPEQQRQFVEFTADSKYSLLFRFLLATGVRVGEALALFKSDVDMMGRTVFITKDVVFIKGQRIEQPPKTEAAVRTLPLSEELCAELLELPEGLLFPYTYNAVRLAIEKIEKQLGFKVTAHVLRHTYSDRLEEAGIPPKVKQYLMGHAKLDTTQNKYTEAQKHYVEAHSEAIRRLFDTK